MEGAIPLGYLDLQQKRTPSTRVQHYYQSGVALRDAAVGNQAEAQR